MPDPVELSVETCEELLCSGVIGRIGFGTPSGPQVFPVNYSVVDRAVIVRTTPYGMLGVHARDAQVAFETDQFDHEYEHGWSVIAHGRLSAVTEPEDLDRIRTVWQPRPWAGGATRSLYLRLPWTQITGRRLGTGWDIFEGLVTRRRSPGTRDATA